MLYRVFKLSSVMILVISGTVIAGDNRVRIFTRDGVIRQQVTSHALNTNGSSLVSVTQRGVVDPAVVVDAALSRQPVHEHLIEVQVGHTTVYLDPSRDYTRQRRNATMTQNNYITAAIQKHQRLTRCGVKLIRGADHAARVKSRKVYPRMILLPRPDLGWPKSSPKRTPGKPVHPHQDDMQRKPGKMAAASGALVSTR